MLLREKLAAGKFEVTFNVVDEPVGQADAICADIGVATVDLLGFERDDRLQEISVNVMSLNHQVCLGKLNLSFEGLHSFLSI